MMHTPLCSPTDQGMCASLSRWGTVPSCVSGSIGGAVVTEPILPTSVNTCNTCTQTAMHARTPRVIWTHATGHATGNVTVGKLGTFTQRREISAQPSFCRSSSSSLHGVVCDADHDDKRADREGRALAVGIPQRHGWLHPGT
eukprot:4402692-Prymnesium_polylepis.1